MVASEFVSELRQRYGIEFHDLSLLDEAFTHSSYVNEHKELGLKDNERLEFLGDAVLELTVSDYLYRKFPDKPEGDQKKRTLTGILNLAKVRKKLGRGNA